MLRELWVGGRLEGLRGGTRRAHGAPHPFPTPVSAPLAHLAAPELYPFTIN